MKMIVAILQPARFPVVQGLLERCGVHGLTVTDAHGAGRQRGRSEAYRGLEYAVNLRPKVRLEVAVDDGEVDRVVEVILAGARSNVEGRIGDGKVFILPLDDVVRIRTGEYGTAAI